MAKEITEGVRQAVAKNLREFGYDVTDVLVGERIDALVRGEKPRDIIGLMAQSQLRDNGYLD